MLKGKMEVTESPLDVLSRAATMVQESQQKLSSRDESITAASNTKQQTSGGTKWKRDKRASNLMRLPEYIRPPTSGKFKEINQENFGSGTSETNNNNSINNNNIPIDMSIRSGRGAPPSYDQAVNNADFNRKSNQTGWNRAANHRLPPGISMCDPIIDEHFRRSLGEDYQTLLLKNHDSSSSSSNKTSPVLAAEKTTNSKDTEDEAQRRMVEFLDPGAMSVDEHFAKALGDTWTKLNSSNSGSKEASKKTNSDISNRGEDVKNGGTVSTNKKHLVSF